MDEYDQLSDAELADVAQDRAALRDCEFALSGTTAGHLAAFERDDPVGGRVALLSAEAGDRRTAIISLLRADDLERPRKP